MDLGHQDQPREASSCSSSQRFASCTSFGVTILMVEHHLNFVMKVSDRVVALDFGKVLAEGSPAEMQRHPEVIRAYLGTAGAPAGAST